ncbi:uncharacterized protein [Antedon mediterranea]|uniref:uncharacterized protein n=1 Tax=Antedon mediterranea TaxID=105859 RepID=UPI003AF72F14
MRGERDITVNVWDRATVVHTVIYVHTQFKYNGIIHFFLTDNDPCHDYSNPCQNSGLCISEGCNFWCKCPTCYTGDSCENEIDPCSDIDCNGGKCDVISTNSVCSYQCINCPAHYSGDNCEIYTNPCDSVDCKNGGNCYINSYYQVYCACQDCYSGTYCEKYNDPCNDDSNPCQNSGLCNSEGCNFWGKCPACYTGDSCEYYINPCEDVNCNGGQCVVISNISQCTYECTNCPYGYTGNNCETHTSGYYAPYGG